MVVIKKYKNRKLYNTTTSKYVNLKDINNLVQNNEQVVILDENNKDISTYTVLLSFLEYDEINVNLLQQFLSKLGENNV